VINVFCVRPKRFNVGNEAINLALRQLLRIGFGGPVNLVQIPAIESDEDGSLSGLGPKTVHEMNLYGHGVVIGGGNLYENGQLDVDVHALSRLRPPLLLFSLSHGRIYDQGHRLTPRTDSMPDTLIKALNDQASRSLVRDEATLAHLRGIGVDRAVMAGCPTLLLDDLIGGALPWEEGESGALLSIRNPQLMNVPLADQARVNRDVRRTIDAIEAEGLGPVRILCHDRRDMSFASSLGEVEYILPDDVMTYLRLLRRASLVVSFRLHAFLPCLSFGTPTVNISYDERSLSLVRTLGLGEWDIDFIQEPDVTEAVLDRVNRIGELPLFVETARPRWRGLAEAMTSEIAGFAEDVYAYAAESIPART
jgi:hypothetical protein